jgi:ribonuclease D
MHQYIRTAAELQSLARELQGAPLLALDTEFVREYQYYPQLEIVQLATPEIQAIVDYRATGTLEPLAGILADPETLKVFHAGSQDLEIFFNLSGTVPAPLFDTQVAAAMVGLGTQVGYARLVESLLGRTLTKSETLTDWARRPLSPAQIDYALDDVRYLLAVYEELSARLKKMGRDQWLEDEWAAMADPAAYRRVSPQEAYRRVQGANRLKPRELAILREVAAWREQEAARRDRVPTHIVRDNLMIELARRAPATTAQLKDIRGLHPREIERQGEAILQAIHKGQSLPRDQWPRQPDRNELSEQESSLVALMQAWLRARAAEADIAPSYLASAADLKELVASEPQERETLEVLRGWRRRLVGADLLALIEGRAYLTWDPAGKRLRLRVQEAAS